MSSHAGVTRTLELLGRLKSTVRDFAAREEKLDQDWSAEVAKLRRWVYGIEEAPADFICRNCIFARERR